MKITFIGKYFCIFIGCLFLWGCPSDYERLESAYYSDDYVNTALIAHEILTKADNHDVLLPFFKQTASFYIPKLRQTIEEIIQRPSTHDLTQLFHLKIALRVLHHQYPIYISHSLVEDVSAYYDEGIRHFSLSTFEDIHSFLLHKQYRRANKALHELDDHHLLLPEQVILQKKLDRFNQRVFMIFPIKVHDLTLEKLTSQFMESVSLQYDTASGTLVEGAVSVPLEFNRHLLHYLRKQSSSFISPVMKSTSPHYALYCRVGVDNDLSISEDQQEVTNQFFVQYDYDDRWYPQEVTYSIYVKSQTVKAIVSAEVRLAHSQKVVGRYIFESLMTDDIIRLGDIFDLPADVKAIQFSQEYKRYKEGMPAKTYDELVQWALDDAAKTLSEKILGTIDLDPDPYAASYEEDLF